MATGALVVVVSALWRMSVYEEAYGFTRLRVFVSAFEIWLGALFVLVLIAGLRLRARWLAPAVVAAWVLTLIGLAALNPDRFIAEQNIARYHRGATLDVPYLSSLSSDAAPALDRLSGPDAHVRAVRDRQRAAGRAGRLALVQRRPHDGRPDRGQPRRAGPVLLRPLLGARF